MLFLPNMFLTALLPLMMWPGSGGISLQVESTGGVTAAKEPHPGPASDTDERWLLLRARIDAMIADSEERQARVGGDLVLTEEQARSAEVELDHQKGDLASLAADYEAALDATGYFLTQIRELNLDVYEVATEREARERARVAREDQDVRLIEHNREIDRRRHRGWLHRVTSFVSEHLVAPPLELVGGEVRHIYKIALHTLKDTTWMVASAATGDMKKASRKAMGVANDGLDAALTPLDAGNRATVAALKVVPVLKPFEPLLMEAPKIIKFHEEFPGAPIFFVNGLQSSLNDDFMSDCDFIAITLHRPVFGIYSDGDHGAVSVIQKIGERLAPGFIPTNRAARQIAWLIAHEDKLNLLTFSGGAIDANMAISTAVACGYATEVKNNLAFVAVGIPIRPEEVQPKPERFLAVAGSQDFVSQVAGGNAWRGGIAGDRGHQLRSYIRDLAKAKLPFFE